MSSEVYCEKKITEALEQFDKAELNASESLIAATKLYISSLDRFKKEAPAFREKLGEEKTREFATQELNELIYEIQDSIPAIVKTYNSLLRDKGQSGDGPQG